MCQHVRVADQCTGVRFVSDCFQKSARYPGEKLQTTFVTHLQHRRTAVVLSGGGCRPRFSDSGYWGPVDREARQELAGRSCVRRPWVKVRILRPRQQQTDTTTPRYSPFTKQVGIFDGAIEILDTAPRIPLPHSGAPHVRHQELIQSDQTREREMSRVQAS
jgi:hypothetical protein